MKDMFAQFILNEYDISHDTNAVLQRYRFLNRVSASPKFNTLKSTHNMNFNTCETLFCELYHWCERTAQLRDLLLFKIFNDKELCNLTIHAPTCKNTVFTTVSNKVFWLKNHDVTVSSIFGCNT